MKTSTMTELINNVIEETKNLIHREKQLIIIDECWRIYAKKIAKMNSLVSPSQRAVSMMADFGPNFEIEVPADQSIEGDDDDQEKGKATIPTNPQSRDNKEKL